MPCYYPIQAWQIFRPEPLKSRLVFTKPRIHGEYASIKLPCGQCIGCRLERSRQWAIRCVHEAKCHEDNSFITLTYRDERLPPGVSLPLYQGGHFQKFLKRLRKAIAPKTLRFFSCGEYGAENARPHYHACLFGYDFSDKVFLKNSVDGLPLYTSKLLTDCWSDPDGVDLPPPKNWQGYYNPKTFGFATVGSVTFESAAYVARYITKKITGDDAEAHYDGRRPEYSTMSRRPGIGKKWYDEFRSDVYPCDNVVLRGKVMHPPKFYDKKYEVDNPEDYARIKHDRKTKALTLAADNTSKRLLVKEACKLAQVEQLKRGYEND